jgi:hypothetical protein
MSRFQSAKNSIEDGTFTALFTALDFYDKAVEDANHFLGSLEPHNQVFKPVKLTDVLKRLPGMMAQYYQLAQEADGIKVFLETQANVVKIKNWKRLKEGGREMSDRLSEKFAEAEKDYVALKELIGEVNLRYELLCGTTKGIDAMGWNIRCVAELHKAGIEDAMV